MSFSLTPLSGFYLFLAIFFNLLYHFILGARFASLVRILNGKVSYLDSFYIFCITKFSSTITPFIAGSLISKPLAAKHYTDLSVGKALLITIFEQLLDFAVLILLFPITLAFAGSYFLSSSKQIYFVLSISLVSLVFILVLFLKYRSLIEFSWKFKNIFPKFLLKLGKKYNLTKENTLATLSEVKTQFLNKKTFLIVSPYTLLQIFIIPLILQFILLSFNFKITYPTVFLVYFLPTIIGRLSGIPGGFGSADLSMGGFLLLLGMAPLDSALAVLLFRIISLAPALLIGGYLTFYLSTKYSLHFFSKETKPYNPKN